MKQSSAILLFLLLSVLLGSEASAQKPEASYPETYMQYVPVAFDLFGGFAGAKSEDVFVDRLIAAGLGYASEILVVNVLKNVVNETRPDGSANNSFPSGHTATAFVGAELVRHEYGWGWGAGAYALATGVGVLRCVHNRHHWWDAVAGAGIGVLCANIGYWTLEPFKSVFGIKTPRNMQISLMPSVDPLYGSVGASFSVRF